MKNVTGKCFMSTRNRESHSFGFVLFLLLPCRIAKMCSSDSKWMRMSGLICRVEVGFNYWRHPYSTRSPCCAKDIDTLWEYLMCHFFLQTLTFTIRWTYCCPMYVIKDTRWYDNSWAPIIKGEYQITGSNSQQPPPALQLECTRTNFQFWY